MLDLQNECHIAMFSETSNAVVFGYAVTQVKDKLLEAREHKQPTPFSRDIHHDMINVGNLCRSGKKVKGWLVRCSRNSSLKQI